MGLGLSTYRWDLSSFELSGESDSGRLLAGELTTGAPRTSGFWRAAGWEADLVSPAVWD